MSERTEKNNYVLYSTLLKNNYVLYSTLLKSFEYSAVCCANLKTEIYNFSKIKKHISEKSAIYCNTVG